MMLWNDCARVQENKNGTSHAAQYPSYKSFDDIIDLQHLRSLDSYLTLRINAYIARDEGDFFCNQHTLEKDAPYRPGVREVWLTRTAPGTPYDYMDIDRTDLWQETPEATNFTLLMDFVRTLPFKSFGRILLIFDRGGNDVPAHRDHESTDICHDFIWFRTNLKKPFYLLNQITGDKLYVSGYSAWFDTVNQYHGSNAADGLSFSFRVDGHFNDEFKSLIPYSQSNPASTPAIWAAKEGGVH
jgi:hypothetical protein